MRRLALRRFPNEVIRRRQGPGARNKYGDFEPGAIEETIYPARILPMNLEDLDKVGGERLFERLKVYVPRGISRVREEPDVLTWEGSALLWGGEPLVWSLDVGILVENETVPFLAAFEDREADVLVYASISYVVVASQTWPRYSRAIGLRET